MKQQTCIVHERKNIFSIRLPVIIIYVKRFCSTRFRVGINNRPIIFSKRSSYCQKKISIFFFFLQSIVTRAQFLANFFVFNCNYYFFFFQKSIWGNFITDRSVRRWFGRETRKWQKTVFNLSIVGRIANGLILKTIKRTR